jgi:hypothetical protein
MHTIVDARRLIPAAHKLAVLSSRGRGGIDRKPLDCAAALAREKVYGCAYYFGVRASGLIQCMVLHTCFVTVSAAKLACAIRLGEQRWGPLGGQAVHIQSSLWQRACVRTHINAFRLLLLRLADHCSASVARSGLSLREAKIVGHHFLAPFLHSTLGRSIVTIWDKRDGFCRLAYPVESDP